MNTKQKWGKKNPLLLYTAAVQLEWTNAWVFLMRGKEEKTVKENYGINNLVLVVVWRNEAADSKRRSLSSD